VELGTEKLFYKGLIKMNAVIDYKELENFLAYLEDKT